MMLAKGLEMQSIILAKIEKILTLNKQKNIIYNAKNL